MVEFRRCPTASARGRRDQPHRENPAHLRRPGTVDMDSTDPMRPRDALRVALAEPLAIEPKVVGMQVPSAERRNPAVEVAIAVGDVNLTMRVSRLRSGDFAVTREDLRMSLALLTAIQRAALDAVNADPAMVRHLHNRRQKRPTPAGEAGSGEAAPSEAPARGHME